MAVKITMPKWGLTMKQGKVTKWFKKEGDPVEKGEALFEVETEKITNAVESTAGGVVFQIVVPAGTVTPVGAVLAVVAAPGEKPARVESGEIGEIVEQEPAKSEPATAAEPVKPEKKKFVPASPAARRLAKELGVDLTSVEGTGPGGRVIEKDVQKHHDEGPPPPKITPLAREMAEQAGLDLSGISGTGDGGKIVKADVERALGQESAGPEEPAIEEAPGPVKSIPFSGMRKSIADNMKASLDNTAQLTAFVEVDVTESIRFLELVRQEYKTDESLRVSMNDVIVLAASRALKRFPIMNSNFSGDEILVFDAVNMGVAVALEEGLIVPVLKNADKKGILQIAREVRLLAKKARENTLDVDDVTGGTFTVTNVSMFQVDGFTPILKPPETGILGVGRIKRKPAEYKGEIALRSMMYLSLTFDHRVVDGAPANAFLQTVARYLEEPALIMS